MKDSHLWTRLLDKVYPGVAEIVRGSSLNKAMDNDLSVRDQSCKHTVSSDRTIAKSYFGRLLGLWTLLRSKRIWSKVIYEHFSVRVSP